MKTISLGIVTLLVASQCAFGLPAKVWTAASVAGDIDVISDSRIQMGGKNGKVVHLRNASGFNRKDAAEILRGLRKSGYDPKRKTLRNGEIVLLVEDTTAAKIKIGNSIVVTGYTLMLSDRGNIFTPGVCKSLKIK